MGGMRALTDPWTLGDVTLPNRVVLAPLAGIGNWFVRLQAKRFGAGLAVSEMISSGRSLNASGRFENTRLFRSWSDSASQALGRRLRLPLGRTAL